jgi:mannitol-1-phosphate/altronate dehydrogenase
VLSCDNIPDNGHVVKNAVLGMAQNVPQRWRMD